MYTNFITYTVIGFITLNIIFQTIIYIRYNQKFVFEYLLNEKSSWNPNIDRMKLATSILFMLFSIFLINSIIKKEAPVYGIIIVNTVLPILSLLIYYILNKTNTEITKNIDFEIVKTKNNFKINLPKEVLETTFDILKENDLIKNINDFDAIPDKEKFIDILISGKLPEERIFKLELDNIQTKFIYEKIKLNSKLFTLEKFLMIFGNKNPKATPNSITTSSNKSINETPKNIEILK